MLTSAIDCGRPVWGSAMSLLDSPACLKASESMARLDDWAPCSARARSRTPSRSSSPCHLDQPACHSEAPVTQPELTRFFSATVLSQSAQLRSLGHCPSVGSPTSYSSGTPTSHLGKWTLCLVFRSCCMGFVGHIWAIVQLFVPRYVSCRCTHLSLRRRHSAPGTQTDLSTN